MRRTAVAVVALALGVQLISAGLSDGRATTSEGLIALTYRPGIDEFLVAVMTPRGTLRGEYPWRGGLDSCCPAWSGDGRQIAFVGITAGGDGEIWLMNADGTAQRLLKRNAGSPAWSPTGERLAFVRSGSIHVMRLDRNDERRMARNADSPTWSPDGRQLAFIRSNDIYVMGADGSNQRRLTRTRAHEASPDWSPTGTRIAYARRLSRSADSYIFVMNADGSGQRRLSRRSEAYDPSWSPDARKLVFSRQGSIMFTINADGTGERRIFPPRGLCTDCSGPDWSPR